MATELARRIRGTRRSLGEKVREQWVSASNLECEPLTFGDLSVGDKFIAMPSPGDNGGHGGLLGGSYLFMKIRPIHDKYGLIQNSACLLHGTIKGYPDSRFVLKIE